jgi:CRISPR-associated exonuclease Cas4
MKAYLEEDLLPLSALQHLLFCERQCALIHIEQVWLENRYTAEGRIMHERADSGRSEIRHNIRIEFGVPLRSFRLGLIGKADVVEFHRGEAGESGSNRWQPFPVEYKRGRPKKQDWDKVQLCAQAICLEEMLTIEIPEGALFYGKTRRRSIVAFDAALRNRTEETAHRLHKLVAEKSTPLPVYSAACDQCSLREVCLPIALGDRRSVDAYIREAIDTK